MAGQGTDLPAAVVDGMVLVARIGATVAAATGVPVLKMVFCGGNPIAQLRAGTLSPTPQPTLNISLSLLPRSLASPAWVCSPSCTGSSLSLVLPVPWYEAVASAFLVQGAMAG